MFLLLFPWGAAALAQPLPSIPAAPAGVRQPLERAEDLVYSETATTSSIRGTLGEAQAALRALPAGPARSYWGARIHLLMGSHLNQQGDSRAAVRELQQGFALLQEARSAGEFSDGLRMEADLHSQMMMARGLIYMMRNGEAARNAAFRARELDPTNVRALISVAGFYLNAPPIAGGDVTAGIAVLEEALSLEPDNRNDRFMILGWLAQAHQSSGELDQAREYIARARQIYPGSPWIAGIAAETTPPTR